MKARRRAAFYPVALLLLGALVAPGTHAAAMPSPEDASPQTIWKPGIRDEKAGFPGPWVRELNRRREVLRRASGRSPNAITGLLGLLIDLHGEVPSQELATLLEGVAKDSRRDPLVRSYAGYLRAQLAASEGEQRQAYEGYRREGYLLDWQIIGPFENAGRAGQRQMFPPEKDAFDANQLMFGKLPSELLEWRIFRNEEVQSGTFVSLDALLSPNTQVTGYATKWVKVAKDTSAALHVGAGGAYKVWVGSDLVGQSELYRSPHPLQDTHAIKLRAGWNRILVKISADEGLWGFTARISQRSGAPLTGILTTTDPQTGTLAPPAPGTVVAETGKPGKPPHSLRAALETRAEKNRPRVEDVLARVEFERWVRLYAPEDRTSAEHAEEADTLAQTARSAYLLYLADPDPNTSRTALATGIERARKEGLPSASLLARLLRQQAWSYQALGFDDRARRTLDESFQVGPDDAHTELALVERMAEDGYTLSSLSWLESMVRRYPESGMLLRAKASRLAELGRTRDALTVYEILLAHHQDEGYVHGQMVEALLELGEADRATELARDRVNSVPGLPAAYVQLAHLEEARGSVGAARSALQKATELSPQDADLHNLLGRLLARNGDTAGGIHSLKRSLALKPQQPGLRDLLASLDTSQADDIFARHDIDFEKIAATPTPKKWEGKDAGILHRRVAVHVLENGLTERLDHRVIRILDDRGTRSQSVQAIAFDPGESYVDVRRARVRRKNGSIEQIGSPSVVSMTEAGYRMFYDRRIQRVIFNGLRPGDTLEVAFVRRDVAARNKFDDYFGELMPMEDILPALHSEYVLEVPATRPLYFNRKVKKLEKEGADTITYRYLLKDQAGILPEAHMPGWTEVTDYLHVSTYANWNDVGRWYWNLVKEQLVVDNKIKAGVAEAMEGLGKDASVRDKVSAIYRHVIRSTRYVGLEFGIHGYKPYRTTDVYDRKFGDCKDKASLLKVMLAEVGINSHLVLVRTRDQGTIGKTPASLSAFNHAIVYVPELDLYLDGTAEFSGPDELPAGDQGASVLVVKDGEGAELRQIPMSQPTVNHQVTLQKVQLQENGGALVTHNLTMRGANAASWRTNLQSTESRKERLTAVWGRFFPGVRVSEIDTPQIENVLAPVKVGAKLEVPHWDQSQPGSLRFTPLGYRTNLVGSLAAQAKRRHDLVLSIPSLEEQTIEYELPRGYTFSQTPQNNKIESPMGKFELRVEIKGRKATVYSRLEYSVTRVPPAKYREFREFLRQVDAALQQVFEARPGQ